MIMKHCHKSALKSGKNHLYVNYFLSVFMKCTYPASRFNMYAIIGPLKIN